ncbi:ATP-dependent DNA helicase PIF1 isoform X1 [Alosa sapidissima]|uniref:ATP-dependent DNA helicase PIF1 isoform X1 n=1 Tax=Alosa sapidissima TaxID=34773 RepID=UPI001C09D646|nr:ATP-dependent DNA helicase PIF1 isoform X1 [Alosa sapidissima]
MLEGDTVIQFQCCVTIERLNKAGLAATSRSVRRAFISLERNEFQEIVIRLHDGKSHQNFTLHDLQLFTRFSKDGKCTVKILPDNIQILISDCPPDQLYIFIKTLRIKHLAWKSSKPLNDRDKFLAGLPRSFVAISPLQQKDVAVLERAHGKNTASDQRLAGRTERNCTAMNGRLQVKRPRADHDDSMKITSLLQVGLLSKLQFWRNYCRKCNILDMINCITLHSKNISLHPRKKPIIALSSGRKLSKEQLAVLNAVLSGKNVFFTGSAGTGKSFLLKRIIGSLPPKSTYATASTGVAACHIGGTTLHNFAGIGSGSGSLESCLELAQRPGVVQNWLSCRHLIIDEISMVDAQFFDKLEAIARSIRRSTEPFGGIQVIVCGDFFQLPPVGKGKDKPQFCFQARSWKKCIQLNMELKEVRRQTDQAFISLLQAVRVGRVTTEITSKLIMSANHNIERDGILATRLCTHKDDVELTNENKLQQLPGTLHQFEAVDSNPNMLRTLDAQSQIGNLLQLKVGAQVMLTKNLDVQRGLVNGARGVVLDFQPGNQGLPRVHFLCGVTEVIRRERWVLKANGGQFISRLQLPLKLAWAISIHKSQGMTLDCVEISLARVFESGQAYVALSRARSLEGLRVLDFNPHIVKANQDVLAFYNKMRKERLILQSSMDTFLGP